MKFIKKSSPISGTFIFNIILLVSLISNQISFFKMLLIFGFIPMRCFSSFSFLWGLPFSFLIEPDFYLGIITMIGLMNPSYCSYGSQSLLISSATIAAYFSPYRMQVFYKCYLSLKRIPMLLLLFFLGVDLVRLLLSKDSSFQQWYRFVYCNVTDDFSLIHARNIYGVSRSMFISGLVSLFVTWHILFYFTRKKFTNNQFIPKIQFEELFFPVVLRGIVHQLVLLQDAIHTVFSSRLLSHMVIPQSKTSI